MEPQHEGLQKIEKLRRIHLDYFQQPGINKLYLSVVSSYLQLLGNIVNNVHNK